MSSQLKLNSVLITGCSRGIGRELVKQFAKLNPAPSHIFATCRKPDDATELQEIAAQHPNVHLLKLDVADQSQFPRLLEQVEKTLEGEGLNALINNAGTASADQDSLDAVTSEYMHEVYSIDTVAPLMLTKALLPVLRRAAETSRVPGLSFSKSGVLNVSSQMASISGNGSGQFYAYRTSKVALNMLTKSLAIDLRKDGIVAISVNPGWVKTAMGGPNAKITTEQSALAILKIMHEVNEEKSGLCLNWEAGETIPW